MPRPARPSSCRVSPAPVRSWRSRLAVGPVNPGLCQDRADQAGTAGGCQDWDPADRPLERQPERRRPNRRSGRVPGPDITPKPPRNHESKTRVGAPPIIPADLRGSPAPGVEVLPAPEQVIMQAREGAVIFDHRQRSRVAKLRAGRWVWRCPAPRMRRGQRLLIRLPGCAAKPSTWRWVRLSRRGCHSQRAGTPRVVRVGPSTPQEHPTILANRSANPAPHSNPRDPPLRPEPLPTLRADGEGQAKG
jgi:hypothetical protein